MKIHLSKRDIVAIPFILYGIIAYIAIRTGFADMQAVTVTYSDGIFYLILDFLMIGILLSSRFIKHNGVIFCFSFVGLIQIAHLLLSEKEPKSVAFIRHIPWILIVIALYALLRQKEEYLYMAKKVFVFVVLFLTALIVYNELVIRNSVMNSGINIVYWCELGLPATYMVYNKRLRMACIIMIGIAVLFSLKATALLAFVLPMLFVYLMQGYIKTGHISIKVILLGMLCFAVYLFLPAIENIVYDLFGLSWATKFENAMDSGGSGRTEIWKSVIDLQSSSTVYQWVFGHGFDGVIAFTKRLSAHNDFLEVLFDYGLVAFIPYLWGVLLLFKHVTALIRKSAQIGIALGINLIQFVILSSFSHLIIYPWFMLSIAFVWAICLAEQDKIAVKNSF